MRITRGRMYQPIVDCQLYSLFQQILLFALSLFQLFFFFRLCTYIYIYICCAHLESVDRGVRPKYFNLFSFLVVNLLVITVKELLLYPLPFLFALISTSNLPRSSCLHTRKYKPRYALLYG
ncbi:hypothetical protein NMG60_11022045 [Bertholletia excelsa]